MASSVTRVVLHPQGLRAVLATPGARHAVLAPAERRAGSAALAAPRLSGAGAASIRAEAVLDGGQWTARVSWDREHYYMYFHERGTQHLLPRPFLVPAFQ
jgi:hypothetical protein